MAASRYPYFSREGWPFLLPVIVAGGAAWYFLGLWWTAPFWLLGLLILFMFRDPRREIPASPLAVVSPVDGRISAIEKLHDPYLDRQALRVQLDMFRSGVYTARSPVEGKILEPGANNQRRLPPEAPHGVWIRTDENDDLVVVMNRGPLGNPPKCDVRYGERVGQGQRCGYLHLGGRIQLYLPENARVVVNINDQVRGGEDVVAHLVHKT
jgi:phosphatidylserine decarboxylase